MLRNLFALRNLFELRNLFTLRNLFMLMNLFMLRNLQKVLLQPISWKRFLKPEISQSLNLGHVTTLSTNQNTGNFQILWDIMRLAKKNFHLKSNAVYNSSAKKQESGEVIVSPIWYSYSILCSWYRKKYHFTWRIAFWPMLSSMHLWSLINSNHLTTNHATHCIKYILRKLRSQNKLSNTVT